MIPTNKYLHETVMRQAFTRMPASPNPLSVIIFTALRRRVGSKLMSGWWVNRAPKRNRRG